MTTYAVLIAAALLAAPDDQAFWALRPGWADMERPKIEWKDTWDDTLSDNTRVWVEQLRKQVERSEVHTRLRVYQAHLADKALQRGGLTETDRIRARLHKAYCLASIGLEEQAYATAVGVIEDHPGRLAAAAEAAWKIIDRANEERDPEKIAYGAERLLALHEAGFLPVGDKRLVRALLKRIDVHIARRRLGLARDDLDRLAEHLRDDPTQLRMLRARQLHYAGRPRQAIELAEAVAESDSDRRMLSAFRRAAAERTRPVYPRRLELETRYEVFVAHPRGRTAEAAHELLTSTADSEAIAWIDEDLHASLWRVIQPAVRGLDGAEARRLIELQQRAAEDRIAERGPGGDGLGAAVDVFRRCPLAPAAQEDLLRAAADALRAGHAGLAMRCFRDVADAAGSGPAAARAARGLELAGPLTAPVSEPPARADDDMTEAALTLPGPPAWVPGQFGGVRAAARELCWWQHGVLMPAGEGTLLYGPNLLAWYPPGRDRPAWVRSANLRCGWRGGYDPMAHDNRLVLPGPAEPAIADGRIFCRWGLDAATALPAHLAAFDLPGGRMAWSTDGDPAWRGLRPLSEPVVADGRLYVLAMHAHADVNTPLELVCLDTSGRTLWRRLIAHRTLTVHGGRAGPLSGRRTNVAAYGAALSVADGAVYVSTSAGLAARCDARDGLVEWVRSYPRMTDRQNVALLVRGGPQRPLIVGDLAIFLPRDLLGAFAVDRDTGAVVWDSPFLPSGWAREIPGGRLLCGDLHGLSVCSAATGRATWTRRLDDAPPTRPAVAGDEILLPTPEALLRLSLADGTTRGSRAWAGEPPTAFRADGKRLLTVSPAADRDTPAVEKAFAEQRLPAGKPFALPTDPGEQLPRVGASLRAPPPEARLPDGRVLLASRDLLELVDLPPKWRVHWRRHVRPGLWNVRWLGGDLLLIHAREVVVLHGPTGRPKWRHEARDGIGGVRELGGHLLLVHNGRPAAVSLLEAATGRFLWRGRPGQGAVRTSSPNLLDATVRGKTAWFLVNNEYHGKEIALVARRVSDGRRLSVRRLDTMHRGHARGFFADGSLFYVDTDGHVREMPLASPEKELVYAKDILARKTGRRFYVREMKLTGPWLQVETYNYDGDDKRHVLVFRRGEPDYTLTLRRWGRIDGDRMWDYHTESLGLIDLEQRKELRRFRLPEVYRDSCEIVDFHVAGDRLYTAAFSRDERREDTTLRLDAFDAETAEHLLRQETDLRYWSSIGHDRYLGRRLALLAPQAIWHDGVLTLAGARGLSTFAPAQAAASRAEEPVIAPTPEPIDPDGRRDDWPAGSDRDVPGARGARWMLTHDDRNLYFGLAHPDRDGRCRTGGGLRAGGDWLELALVTRSRSLRFAVGRGPDGRVRAEPFGNGASAPDSLRAACRHDLARGETVYELALPFEAVVSRDREGRWRRMRLAATAWDDRPAGGPVPVARVGDGLGLASPVEAKYLPFRLGRLQLPHRRAALALARGAIGLPEVTDLLRAVIGDLAPDRDRVPRPLVELLTHHARTPMALRAMVVLDLAYRERIDEDPSEMILAAAEAAGVPRRVRQKYLAATRRTLSQWVRMDTKQKQQMVMVMLRDGEGNWGHRVYWGNSRIADGRHGTEERRQAAEKAPPGGQWAELTAPLIWIDMHDRPITGLRLILWGHGWLDRTAVRWPGGEKVLLEDAFPAGEVESDLEWVTDPVMSGRKALAKTSSRPFRGISARIEPNEPFTAHLAGLGETPKLDADKARAALRAHLPELGDSPFRKPLLEALIGLAGDDKQRVAETIRWVLKADPDSPDAYDLLARLRGNYRSRNMEDWPDRLAAVLNEVDMPEEKAYLFRTRLLDRPPNPIEAFRVLGPFHVGKETKRTEFSHPLEGRAINLTRGWPAAGDEKARWRLVEAKDGWVDLDAFYGDEHDYAAAYAACWLLARERTAVRFDLGADDHGKLWINGRELGKAFTGGGDERRAHRIRGVLTEGWNELVYRVIDDERNWGFSVELYRADGRPVGDAVKAFSIPPGKK